MSARSLVQDSGCVSPPAPSRTIAEFDEQCVRIGLAARAIAAAPPAAGVPRQLAIAIRAACGIEALVWLTDVAQLSRRDASALMRSSAQALLNAALAT